MEETSLLREKVETEKKGEGKVGVVGEVDMVLILHEKVAIKMGFGKHFCFLETETETETVYLPLTTYHLPQNTPPSFLFLFFYFSILFLLLFKMFGACMHQLNPSHHPSYIIITSKTSASKKENSNKKIKTKIKYFQNNKIYIY